MRIMTSNIWGDYFGNPVYLREDLLYEVFKKYSPDIIGMQEFTLGWYNSHILEWLSKDYMCVGTEAQNSKNYVPLVYKKEYNLRAMGYEYLENTPDESKGITWAFLKKEDGTKMVVCNTHFWWMSGPEHDAIRLDNARQLTELMKELHKKYDCPVFAFGDMNCRLSSDVFKFYAKNGIKHLHDLAKEKDNVSSHHGDPILDDDGRYHGYKTNNGKECSNDHMLALGDCFEVLEYRIVEDQAALDASDHSPVYVDIEFK